MSARYGRAQGVALAGVAAVGLLVGGMVLVGSGGANAGVPVEPVLEGSAPQWADGYNHFVLTMSGPVPLAADGSVTRGPATAKPAGGQRGAAGKADQAVRPAAQVSVRLAAQASAWLGAGNAPGVITKGAHSPQGAPSPQRAASSQGAASTRIPSQQDGIPWQAVTPNSANPIVWRPGQPISVLARNLARYPKGTTLERDSEGNIRAVLPRGTKVTPPAKAPVPPEVATRRPTAASDQPGPRMASTHRAGPGQPGDRELAFEGAGRPLGVAGVGDQVPDCDDPECSPDKGVAGGKSRGPQQPDGIFVVAGDERPGPF